MTSIEFFLTSTCKFPKLKHATDKTIALLVVSAKSFLQASILQLHLEENKEKYI